MLHPYNMSAQVYDENPCECRNDAGSLQSGIRYCMKELGKGLHLAWEKDIRYRLNN